jgi:hypothetical protein
MDFNELQAARLGITDHELMMARGAKMADERAATEAQRQAGPCHPCDGLCPHEVAADADYFLGALNYGLPYKWTADEQSEAEHYRRLEAEEINFCLSALNYGLPIDFPVR